MKSESRLPDANQPEQRAPFLRFTVAGAVLGLLVGLYEAGLLYFTPRIPTLLETDVSYVIWFLAPLLDLSLFTALGASLGLAARGARNRSHPWTASLLVAVGLGVAAFYTALAVGLSQVWVLGRLRLRLLLVPSLCFLALFVSALILLRIRQRRRQHLLGAALPSLATARVPIVAAAICALGLAFISIYRPIRGVSKQPPAGGRERPNLVLIVLDTVRAGELSAYGYSRPTTPNLDRLARQGVLFENALSSSSWTLPSDASILTGLLPHQHGANWATPIAPSIRTLADDLEVLGYETAGFNANLVYGEAGWGIGKGFEVYEDDSSSLRHNLAVTLAGRLLVQPLYERLAHPNSFDRRSAREVNKDIYRWFGRRSGRPFFLFVNYFDTHYPYVAPPPYDHRFGRIPDTAMRRAVNFEYRGGVPKPLLAERDQVIAAYDNCLAFLDDQVGQFLQFLARSPERSNTIVIITSDHGEAFGEHAAYGHGINLYREALHVPLIFFGPGIPAGLRVNHIVRSREIFQTIIDLVSGEHLRFNRSSFRRFWTPGFKPGPSDDTALSELIAVISLTTPEWHYLNHADGHSELYHWPTDLQEKIDLSGAPPYRGTLAAMQALLGHRVGISVAPWRGPDYLLGIRRLGFRSLLEERALVSQTSLTSDEASKHAQPMSEEDKDLLNNLPYR